MGKIFKVIVLLSVLANVSMSARAQMVVPPPTPAYQPLSDAQFDQLLGPIALYPDPLIAQILPASTFPTEIVLADRYVSGGGDPNQIDQQPWDASVQALARYPSVLKWMDGNLNWTTELGQAFLNQQQDVMNSIQHLRTAAYNLGNLQSTPQQQVVNDGGYIEILPAEPQVIYVPVYQPDEVYYQSGFGLSFGISFPIGIWLSCDFDWHHHNLIVWSHDHPRPANWWQERPDQRAAVFVRNTVVWHPVNRPASGAANWGDRGRGDNAPAPALNRPEARPLQQHNADIINTPRPASTPGSTSVSRPSAVPVPAQHPAPAPVQHYEAAGQPAANNAFIGIQSARDARSYSERGQQSMQTVNRSEPVHSAPVSRPAPSSSGGGGGGSHEPGSQPKR
jgi:hypothetical protein